MLVFPNVKINLGLNIIRKREDGYHDLETVFYPLGLADILEFTINKSKTEFAQTGLILDTGTANNLVVKAYDLLKEKYNLPELNIHLHKNIPSGAGLGGGSSDAAFMLKTLNEYFKLGIKNKKIFAYADELGSDCPFFLRNEPVFAEGTGNIFSKVNIDLNKFYIFLIKPNIHISTKEAFSGILPKTPKKCLKDIINLPIDQWKKCMINDFEKNIFIRYPEIKQIKDKLYDLGAIYAQMSGSGASVFGFFIDEPLVPKEFKKYFTYIQKPLVKD